MGLIEFASSCRTFHADPTFRTEIRPEAHQLPTLRSAERWRWVKRGTLPGPERQACDLESTPAGLVVAASTNIFDEDGAAVFRLDDEHRLERLLKWSGQGFLRVHSYSNRLVVPDGDAPFSPLSFIFSWNVDEYVFISDANGALTTRGREVLPRAYHVFDTALLPNGRLIASTGAYPEGEIAYLSKYGPAALFMDDGEGKPWRRILEYPARNVPGVVRLTYLELLPDGALLAGVQSNRGDLPDAVRIEGLPDAPKVFPIDSLSGWTLRWSQWRGAIYHVAQVQGGTLLSRSTDGGRTFTPIRGGSPQALLPTKDALLLLDHGALLQSTDGVRFEVISEPNPALQHEPSSLVSAPLVLHRGHPWAASPVTGEIFEAVPEE